MVADVYWLIEDCNRFKAMSNDTQLLITPTAWTQVGETVISKQEDS